MKVNGLLGSTFSPLFVGAKVETSIFSDLTYPHEEAFSPLFVGAKVETKAECYKFLSDSTFSPLFVGAKVETAEAIAHIESEEFFQSPFRRGKG